MIFEVLKVGQANLSKITEIIFYFTSTKKGDRKKPCQLWLPSKYNLFVVAYDKDKQLSCWEEKYEIIITQNSWWMKVINQDHLIAWHACWQSQSKWQFSYTILNSKQNQYGV